MFEDHAQAGEFLHPGLKAALDEHRLAVEDIDIVIGDLAVHQERHVDLLHTLEHAANLDEVGDAEG